MAVLSGTQEFNGVTALKLNVRNGTIDCTEADLPEGTVNLEWEYGGKDIDRADPADFELRLSQAATELTAEDWHDQAAAPLEKLNIKLNLIVRHGPGVNVVDFNHGNGTLSYTGTAHGDFSLGNGTMSLAGEPAGDIDVSVGNGKVNARWLLTGGSCDVSVGNGSTDIDLLEGSSFTLSGSVGIGSISAPAGIDVNRSHLLGANAAGSLGNGAARLDISIGNGSIKIDQL